MLSHCAFDTKTCLLSTRDVRLRMILSIFTQFAVNVGIRASYHVQSLFRQMLVVWEIWEVQSFMIYRIFSVIGIISALKDSIQIHSMLVIESIVNYPKLFSREAMSPITRNLRRRKKCYDAIVVARLHNLI